MAGLNKWIHFHITSAAVITHSSTGLSGWG